MKTKVIDYTLFFIIFFLMVFGMIMISSVSVYPSYKVTNTMVQLGKLSEPNNYFYLLRNISHVFISLLVLVIFSKTPYRLIEKYARQIFGWVLIFLVIVLFVWVTYNWARWWINIPLIPFSLQPAEFLKLWLIIYLSYFLKRKKQEISDLKEGFMPFMFIVWIIVILLALQPDFWTVLIVVPISMIMLFVAWWNIKHIMILIISWIIFTLAVYMIWKLWWETKNTLSYISQRFDNFLSSNQTAIENKTINFQTLQWLIAIWSWWFLGLWFWKSIQKFWYLPEVQWDFIFSVIWEELWFIWILILVWLYIYIANRWFSIAARVQEPFWKYMAIWITSWIIIQAFINIWVNLNIVPLTWITLPFISYGWSSLVSLMIAVWILLNISREAEFEKNISKNVRMFKRNKIFSK